LTTATMPPPAGVEAKFEIRSLNMPAIATATGEFAQSATFVHTAG
jgi:hypothetical protein